VNPAGYRARASADAKVLEIGVQAGLVVTL
jgi:hypothetical protein